MTTPKPTTPKPVEAFKFLSVLDGNMYTLPPYDREKFSDEVGKHFASVPKVTLSDALLYEDPLEGVEALNKPAQSLNVLMKAAMFKTLRNHLEVADPAWVALKALVDAGEFDALGKVFSEWQKHYGVTGVDVEGEG
jgi:hypothetical protein